MSARSITPYRTAKRIVMGEIVAGPTYANYRPEGSGDCLGILTLDGCGQIVLGEEGSETRLMERGDLLVFEQGALQDYGTSPGSELWHLRYAHFQPTARHQLQLEKLSGSSGYRKARLGEHGLSVSRAAFEEGFAARALPPPLCHDLMENALERVLIWANAPRSASGSQRVDARVEKALGVMQCELSGRLSLEELARRCGLSRARFAQLFKEQVGVSPQQAWEAERMRQAKTLLSSTSFAVGEVAGQVGYEDPFYFSTRFRKMVGCSPSEYRRRRNP